MTIEPNPPPERKRTTYDAPTRQVSLADWEINAIIKMTDTTLQFSGNIAIAPPAQTEAIKELADYLRHTQEDPEAS